MNHNDAKKQISRWKLQIDIVSKQGVFLKLTLIAFIEYLIGKIKQMINIFIYPPGVKIT